MTYAYETVLGLEHGMFLVTAKFIIKFIIVGSKRSHCASDEPTSQNKTDPYLNTKCMPWIMWLSTWSLSFLSCRIGLVNVSCGAVVQIK